MSASAAGFSAASVSFQNTYERGRARHQRPTQGQARRLLAIENGPRELLLGSERTWLVPDVSTQLRLSSLRGLFNEGMFILRVSGKGTLFFSAYGDIQEIEVDGGYIVDNGHAVAWDSTLDYRLTRARKIRSFLFSDQIIMEFSGRGRLWVQSRNPRSPAN